LDANGLTEVSLCNLEQEQIAIPTEQPQGGSFAAAKTSAIIGVTKPSQVKEELKTTSLFDHLQ